MKKNIDLHTIIPRLRKLTKIFGQHAVFAATMIVLLVYLLVVWQINKLASTEPSPESQSAALTSVKIPKVDKTAVTQIENLEQTNTAVHSLFNEARNNPFQE